LLHQSLLLKVRMKEAQTQMRKILTRTLAAAAVVIMKLKKALDAKNLLRRSISLAKIVVKLAQNGDLCKYVNSWVCGTLSK
jgi:hypothetical protein